jgi:hypothetical protein
MHSDAVLNLTGRMELLIDEHRDPLTVMRELLELARSLHHSVHVDRFAIGDGVYSLEDLRRIMDQEEHEAFVARQR